LKKEKNIISHFTQNNFWADYSENTYIQQTEKKPQTAYLTSGFYTNFKFTENTVKGKIKRKGRLLPSEMIL